MAGEQSHVEEHRRQEATSLMVQKKWLVVGTVVTVALFATITAVSNTIPLPRDQGRI